MPNRFTAAARKAADLTNKQLATEISEITSLNRDRVNELLPTKKDREAFLALMQQVEADTEMDKKLAYLRENLESAGVLVIKLLKAMI